MSAVLNERVVSKRDGSVRFVMRRAGPAICGNDNRVWFAKAPDAPEGEWTIWTAQAFRRIFG